MQMYIIVYNSVTVIHQQKKYCLYQPQSNENNISVCNTRSCRRLEHKYAIAFISI